MAAARRTHSSATEIAVRQFRASLVKVRETVYNRKKKVNTLQQALQKSFKLALNSGLTGINFNTAEHLADVNDRKKPFECCRMQTHAEVLASIAQNR